MKTTAFFLLVALLLPDGLHAADPAAVPVSAGMDALAAQVEGLVQAGVDREAADRAVRAMAQNRFSRQQIDAVCQVIDAAHRQGLPTAPVVAKLFEGLAKQATAAMTVRAMDRVAARQRYADDQARRLAGDQRRRAELAEIMAAGLAAGLTPEDMATLVDRLDARGRQMSRDEGSRLTHETLLIARDMARQGVASAKIGQLVGRAMQQGLGADSMRRVRQSMNARRGGHSPESLARGYAEAIGGARAGADPQGSGQAGGGSQGAAGGGSGGSGSGGSSGSGGGGSGGSGSGGSGGSGGGGSGGSGGGGSGGSGGGGRQ